MRKSTHCGCFWKMDRRMSTRRLRLTGSRPCSSQPRRAFLNWRTVLFERDMRTSTIQWLGDPCALRLNLIILRWCSSYTERTRSISMDLPCFAPLKVASEGCHFELVHFFVAEDLARRSKESGVTDESVQAYAAATTSSLKESRLDLATLERRFLELESEMAREVSNNTDLAMNLVSKERRAQKAEAAVGSAQEGQRYILTQASQAEKRTEEAEGMAGDAESRTGEAVVKANQLESKFEQAEKIGQMAVENLRDMEKRTGEAESKAGRPEIKLGASSKLSEDLRTENQRLFTRAESAEAMTRRVRVEAEEDMSAARSDVSAARTGVYLQNSQAAHIKVKLEAQLGDSMEHENEQASLREKVEELEDCVLCLNKPNTMCLLPCSHVCICESCAGESWTNPCPICRAPVTSQRRMFVA